jgi:hypothetical protein
MTQEQTRVVALEINRDVTSVEAQRTRDTSLKDRVGVQVDRAGEIVRAA